MKKIIYIHDPMCSWCWGFSDVLNQFLSRLPPDIGVIRLLGGLAPDSDEAMSEGMQQSLAGTWRRIEKTIPGVRFNFDFWQSCKPRRSTYPACRAVIAARLQGEEFDVIMTQAIQRAYYQQARNPSDNEVLIELAGEVGLNVDRFGRDICDRKTEEELKREIAEARRLKVDSFPAMLLIHNNETKDIPINYTGSNSMLKLIHGALNFS